MLCGGNEEADHRWTCKTLEKKRADVAEEIAKLDPGKLPAAVKQGGAPAMKANPRHPYWGKQEGEEKDHRLRFLCDCSSENSIGPVVKEKTENLDDHITARAMMQERINEYGGGICHSRKEAPKVAHRKSQMSSPTAVSRIQRKQFG